jgi:hypothetical protein
MLITCYHEGSSEEEEALIISGAKIDDSLFYSLSLKVESLEEVW